MSRLLQARAQVRWRSVAGALVFVGSLSVHASAQETPAVPPPGAAARPVFPAQQRPAGDPVVVARGEGLYRAHCRACHGADLRGGDQGGPNLLRSAAVLNDQAGELLLPIVQNGQRGTGVMPPIALMADDVRAVAEYIHGVAATMRGQGNPPPGTVPVLDVLVGDATRGRAYFEATCAMCHSVTGDLRGIAARVAGPTTLQNYWLSAGGKLGRVARGESGTLTPVRPDVKVVVTAASGSKVTGQLVRIDDFYIVVRLADGTQRSFVRSGDTPVIDIDDPYEPHRKMLPLYRDRDIHDVTAYLATVK